jgi:hypothetical protein
VASFPLPNDLVKEAGAANLTYRWGSLDFRRAARQVWNWAQGWWPHPERFCLYPFISARGWSREVGCWLMYRPQYFQTREDLPLPTVRRMQMVYLSTVTHGPCPSPSPSLFLSHVSLNHGLQAALKCTPEAFAKHGRERAGGVECTSNPSI